MSTNKLVSSHLENGEGRHFAIYRCLLDLRIAQFVTAMKLTGCEDGREAICIPKTGGRWLYTTEGCEAQPLHTDFPILTDDERMKNENPGCFPIATGEENSAIRVSSQSQNLIPCFRDDPMSLRMLSKLCHDIVLQDAS